MKHDKPRYAAFDDEPKGTWTNPPPLAPEPEPRRLKMLHQSDVQTWLSARRIEAQRQLFAAASEGRDDALPGFRAQLDVIAELEQRSANGLCRRRARARAVGRACRERCAEFRSRGGPARA